MQDSVRLQWCVFQAAVSKGWVHKTAGCKEQTKENKSTKHWTNLFLPKRNGVRWRCEQRAEVNTVFFSLFGSVLHLKQSWEPAWSTASDKRPLWELITAARPKEMKERSQHRRATAISPCDRVINHSTLHTTAQPNECEQWCGQGHDLLHQ